MPQINLEGSGEPTMAKDLPEYVKTVKKKSKMFHVLQWSKIEWKIYERYY